MIFKQYISLFINNYEILIFIIFQSVFPLLWFLHNFISIQYNKDTKIAEPKTIKLCFV